MIRRRKTWMACLAMLTLLVTIVWDSPAQAATYSRLYSVGTGRCMIPARTPQIVKLETCANTDIQLWSFVGHGGGYYSAVSKATGGCIDLDGQMVSCAGYPARVQWYIHFRSSTVFQAISRADASRCMQATKFPDYYTLVSGACSSSSNMQLFQLR